MPITNIIQDIPKELDFKGIKLKSPFPIASLDKGKDWPEIFEHFEL